MTTRSIREGDFRNDIFALRYTKLTKNYLFERKPHGTFPTTTMNVGIPINWESSFTSDTGSIVEFEVTFAPVWRWMSEYPEVEAGGTITTKHASVSAINGKLKRFGMLGLVPFVDFGFASEEGVVGTWSSPTAAPWAFIPATAGSQFSGVSGPSVGLTGVEASTASCRHLPLLKTRFHASSWTTNGGYTYAVVNSWGNSIEWKTESTSISYPGLYLVTIPKENARIFSGRTQRPRLPHIQCRHASPRANYSNIQRNAPKQLLTYRANNRLYAYRRRNRHSYSAKHSHRNKCCNI